MYDAENRLVRASGATSATLAYDPLRRFQLVPSLYPVNWVWESQWLERRSTALLAFVTICRDRMRSWYASSYACVVVFRIPDQWRDFWKSAVRC